MFYKAAIHSKVTVVCRFKKSFFLPQIRKARLSMKGLWTPIQRWFFLVMLRHPRGSNFRWDGPISIFSCLIIQQTVIIVHPCSDRTVATHSEIPGKPMGQHAFWCICFRWAFFDTRKLGSFLSNPGTVNLVVFTCFHQVRQRWNLKIFMMEPPTWRGDNKFTTF